MGPHLCEILNQICALFPEGLARCSLLEVLGVEIEHSVQRALGRLLRVLAEAGLLGESEARRGAALEVVHGIAVVQSPDRVHHLVAVL